jgi:hypothetical protein
MYSYSFIKEAVLLTKLDQEIKSLGIDALLGISQEGDAIIVHTDRELSSAELGSVQDTISVHEFTQAEVTRLHIPDVTPRQIRQALILAGKSLSDIENIIDGLPEPQRSLVKIEWEYSTMFERNNQFVIAMGPLCGLSETDMDNLWTLARTL